MEATIQKKDRMLVHICCAGCGVYVSNVLKEGFEVFLYFYNPNIFPDIEHEKRKKEVEKIAKHFDLPLYFDIPDHGEWLNKIKGLEKEPEKGKRCYLCYEYRLERLAKKAKEMGIERIGTSLSVSPYKEFAFIKEIGERIARGYGLDFWGEDFKKNDGYKKSILLSKELDIYRQNYCGCEFSLR